MKADNMTHSEVNAVLKGIFDAYKKRNLQGMLALIASDPDVLVVGSGEDELAIGSSEFGKSVGLDWAQSESASVNFKDVAVSAAGSVAWFAADVEFQFTIAGKKSDLPGRLTGVLENKKGKWLIMQLHFSVPACKQ